MRRGRKNSACGLTASWPGKPGGLQRRLAPHRGRLCVCSLLNWSSGGIFALLRGLLRVKGSGLSKISLKQLRPFFFTPVKLSLFSLPALLLASLAFTAAPALAAAPEAPGVVTVESITESTANLRGVLNPGTLAEPPQEGTYEFIYNETVAGQRCEEGFKSKRGLSFGNAGADGMW